MLDIGGSIGALVVYAPEAFAGVEIELAKRGETQQFVHTEVRERILPGGACTRPCSSRCRRASTRCSARRPGARTDVVIRAAHVTEVHW